MAVAAAARRTGLRWFFVWVPFPLRRLARRAQRELPIGGGGGKWGRVGWWDEGRGCPGEGKTLPLVAAKRGRRVGSRLDRTWQSTRVSRAPAFFGVESGGIVCLLRTMLWIRREAGSAR